MATINKNARARRPITEMFKLDTGEIQFTCVRCCKKMIAKPMLAGSLSRCPLCQKLIRIPSIPEVQQVNKPYSSKHLIRSLIAPSDPLLEAQEIIPLAHFDDGLDFESENLLDVLMNINMYSPAALKKKSNIQPNLQGQSKFLDFDVIEKIGDGGMGTVFRVHRKGIDYALKLLDSSLVQDSRYLRRFEQEALTLSKINHENIVRVFDFGIQENRPFILMEFCNGPSLRELVYRRGPMPLPLAAVVIRDIAKGLRKASELGIIHRDVKPDNALFHFDKGSNTVKLVDFGLVKQIGKMKVPKKGLQLSERDLMEISDEFSKQIRRIYKGRDSNLSWQEKISKILETVRANIRQQKKINIEPVIIKEFEYLKNIKDNAHSLGLTKTGECFGTPKYMAPEMWLDIPSDFRSDIFALGITWFWIISGGYPYPGKNASETMQGILKNPPIPIENIISVIPKSVKSMIETMTAKLPDQRYQSYELLNNDLNRLLSGEEPVIDTFGEILQIDKEIEFDNIEKEADFLINIFKTFVNKVRIQPPTDPKKP